MLVAFSKYVELYELDFGDMYTRLKAGKKT